MQYRTLLLSATLLAAPLSGTALAGDVKLDSTTQKMGYAIGLQVGQSLKQDGIKVDSKALALAVDDVMSGHEPRMTQEQMQETIMNVQKEKADSMLRAAKVNEAKGVKYLAKNKKKKGVKTTASGLQYEVLKSGKGKSPKETDQVKVHYRGTLISGEEFDSSYSRNEPAVFPVNRVIKGWTEVLQLMKEGDKWRVTIPSALAYGERGTGHGIGPNETLIFEVELLEVMAGMPANHGKASPH